VQQFLRFLTFVAGMPGADPRVARRSAVGVRRQCENQQYGERSQTSTGPLAARTNAGT
jgi:hypothetical protein